jgi:hypothetical protein
MPASFRQTELRDGMGQVRHYHSVRGKSSSAPAVTLNHDSREFNLM